MSRSGRYHYRECGLDNVYLLNGYEFVETPRGRGVIIKNVDGLHLAIGRILVREKKSLNGKEFRFLRHELNLTQQSLALILRVSAQEVARWEKGQTSIPGPVQGLVRVIYEEKTNGNQKIIEPLRKLAELDELLGEEDIAFEADGADWHLSPLAA